MDSTADGWLDYEWQLPDTPAPQVLIRITDYLDSGLSDDSDASFAVVTAGKTQSDGVVAQGGLLVHGGCSLTSTTGRDGQQLPVGSSVALLALILVALRRRRC